MLNRKNIFIFLFCVTQLTVIFAQTEDIDVSYYKSTSNANAYPFVEQQNKKVDNFLTKVSVGGTLGLQLGRYTNIEVSPDVAYHFNDWICLGIGGTYIFSHYNDNQSVSEPINSHVGGLGAFAEGHLFNYVALHVEYRWLNYDLYTYNTHNVIEKTRINSHNILLGGGFYRKIDKFAIYFQIFYNISNRSVQENILDDVVYKAGFAFFLK